MHPQDENRGVDLWEALPEYAMSTAIMMYAYAKGKEEFTEEEMLAAIKGLEALIVGGSMAELILKGHASFKLDEDGKVVIHALKGRELSMMQKRLAEMRERLGYDE